MTARVTRADGRSQTTPAWGRSAGDGRVLASVQGPPGRVRVLSRAGRAARGRVSARVWRLVPLGHRAPTAASYNGQDAGPSDCRPAGYRQPGPHGRVGAGRHPGRRRLGGQGGMTAERSDRVDDHERASKREQAAERATGPASGGEQGDRAREPQEAERRRERGCGPAGEVLGDDRNPVCEREPDPGPRCTPGEQDGRRPDQADAQRRSQLSTQSTRTGGARTGGARTGRTRTGRTRTGGSSVRLAHLASGDRGSAGGAAGTVCSVAAAATAWSTAAAFAAHSASSAAGSESATMPAPAWT